MNLRPFDDQLVRAVTDEGEVFTGFAEFLSAGYAADAYGPEEEALRIGDTLLFAGSLRSVGPLGLRRVFRRFEELTPAELYAILKARVDVFVVEQRCPYAELDGLDQSAVHVWLEDGEGLRAYLRVLPRGAESEYAAIGRVLTLKRGRGLGRLLLREGIGAAEDFFGAEEIYLEAQTQARGFYEKEGFRAMSEEVFPIDGIPHVRMLRRSADAGE